MPNYRVDIDIYNGPMDLLLYLIRKQNLDILNIPVADITKQYMGYIELMRAVKRARTIAFLPFTSD